MPALNNKDMYSRGAGKGSAPRNVSSKFKKNYDSIRWGALDSEEPRLLKPPKGDGKKIYSY